MKQDIPSILKKPYSPYPWAQCVTRENGDLVIVFSDACSGSRYGAVSELSHTELPVHSKRKRITTCFSHWETISSTEYTEALRIPTNLSSHLIWKFKVGKREFIIPALAIMRAIFRPHAVLLTQLFRPQALEGICVPTADGFAFTKSWSSLAKRDKTNSLLDPIEWMWCYPSAKKMASSLYQFALRGELGMLLPLAKMRATVYGIEVGNILYVTKISIATIEPREPPFPFYNSQKHIFTFADTYKSHRKEEGNKITNHLLPTHPNGDWKVTDEEWVLLNNFLKNNRPATKYDRRTLLNGILQKLCTGVSWRNCSYDAGTFVTASKQYLYWKSNGTIENIEKIILARNTNIFNIQKENKKEENKQRKFSSLSDSEWEHIEIILKKESGIFKKRNQEKRKYSHRHIINEILIRLVEKKPWKKDRYVSHNEIYSIYTTYLSWKKNGDLEKIITAFNQVRPENKKL